MTLKVAIVGAGIAGLSAAIGFALNNHEVTVFERRKEAAHEESGSGIQLQPGALRILKAWGMMDDLQKFVEKNPQADIRRYSTGDVLYSGDNERRGGQVEQ